jgi:pimeloyl-ACP methyl ester carboxylesterase
MKLIFVHGSGSTGEVWEYQVHNFTGSEAVNLPGHPQGKPCTSVAGYAGWLHEYIVSKGYNDVVLAGHSLGGAIVQSFALDYPQALRAIILVGSGARLRVHPDVLTMVEAGISNPQKWLNEFVKPDLVNVPSDLRETVIRKMAEVGPAVQLNDFRCCDKFDIMERISSIKIPVLAIVGTEDKMTPLKYSQFVVGKIGNARLALIEGGSHFAFMEKPALVNSAIEQFLGGL